MLQNYYIIRQSAEEIRSRLSGLFFVRAYSIQAHELRIEFAGDEASELLIIRLAPGKAALYLAGQIFDPPKRNVTSFFTELEGKVLSAVAIARYDRLIILSFGDRNLTLRFFDRPNAMLFVNGALIGSFKKASAADAEVAISDEPFDSTKSLSLLSKPLRKELTHRNAEIEQFEAELRSSVTTCLYKHSPEFLVSPIRLQSIDATPQQFRSPSEAIELSVIHRERTQALEGSRRSLLHTVDTIIDKTSTARTEAAGSISDSTRIDRYMHIGQDILTRADELTRGTTTFTFTDGKGEHTIQLDPSQTPYENANRFFEKARTAKARKADVVARVASLDKDEETLLVLRERIVEAESVKALDAIRKDLSAGRYTLQQAADAIGTTGPRFREYEVAGGMRVLIGKNAKQNDELTLHVAQKEDIWFHARHVSGSHVVLRSGKRPNIPQRAIEQAAELAAYFSDARSQKHAPVAYTRRKYVRKPRGAAPGAVKLEREEVIIVTPQISAHPISP